MGFSQSPISNRQSPIASKNFPSQPMGIIFQQGKNENRISE
jgi:hypothetical protein